VIATCELDIFAADGMAVAGGEVSKRRPERAADFRLKVMHGARKAGDIHWAGVSDSKNARWTFCGPVFRTRFKRNRVGHGCCLSGSIA
jgi:hypothetical protein